MTCSLAGGAMAGFGFVGAIALVCGCLIAGIWIALGGRLKRPTQTPDE